MIKIINKNKITLEKAIGIIIFGYIFIKPIFFEFKFRSIEIYIGIALLFIAFISVLRTINDKKGDENKI